MPEGPGSWSFSLAAVLRRCVRVRPLADEIALWTVPVVVLFSMSFLTDINLGLRYVLAILPYVFIATGKVGSMRDGTDRIPQEAG